MKDGTLGAVYEGYVQQLYSGGSNVAGRRVGADERGGEQELWSSI